METRNNFLSKAAFQYAITAPLASAYLMSLVNQDQTRASTQKRGRASPRSCQACGTIFLAGWNSSSCTKPGNSKSKRRNSKGTARPSSVMITECLVCRRYTPDELLPVKPKTVSKDQQSLPLAPNDTSHQIQGKRSRKTRGLRALLAKSTEDSFKSTSVELTISDFLKKP